MPIQVPENSKSGLKVFLSYSRKDDAFAKELLAALELLGFDAYLDTEDIAPGEPWEDRLGNLIRQADTVVFLISPKSLASQHCGWEVEQTARSGKRLVPVIILLEGARRAGSGPSGRRRLGTRAYALRRTGIAMDGTRQARGTTPTRQRPQRRQGLGQAPPGECPRSIRRPTALHGGQRQGGTG